MIFTFKTARKVFCKNDYKIKIQQYDVLKSKWFNPFWMIIAILIVFFVVNVVPKKPVIEYDDAGKAKLAAWRTAKLLKELEDLDEAEQYVLFAAEDGIFPCYSCLNTATIFLKKSEVWRYGYTTKGKKGRYGNIKLMNLGLEYYVQFRGTITQCMKEEKRKIYYYPLLPESLKRSIILQRPPGNKKDF